MEILKYIFYIILEMSIVASIVGSITLILKNILKFKISPKWLNITWIVFLIVLINPIRFESKYSIYNFLNYEAIASDSINNSTIKEALDKHTNNNSYLDVATSSGLETNSILEDYDIYGSILIKHILSNLNTIIEIVIILYFSVTLIKIIINIFTNSIINKNTQNIFANERLEAIFKSAKQSIGTNKNIKIIKQDIINTPAVYGIIKPKILLNADILNLSDEEIKLILLHELSHIKNGDILLNKLIQLLKIIYWFNPLICFFLNNIKEDIELANDEIVLTNAEKNSINTYCKTLLMVSLVSNNKICSTLGIVTKTNSLEERIRMIKEKEKFLKNKTLIITIVLMLVFGITVCFATSRLTNTENNIDELTDLQDISKLVNLTNNEISKSTENVVTPLEGEMVITATYGNRKHPVLEEYIVHDGIDLAAKTGDKVMAIADGVVESTGFDVDNGNLIVVKHADEKTNDTFYSYYAQLSKIEVEEGDVVEAGSKIGEAGSTGKSTGPHLHLEIRDSEKNTIDPSTIIDF